MQATTQHRTKEDWQNIQELMREEGTKLKIINITRRWEGG